MPFHLRIDRPSSVDVDVNVPDRLYECTQQQGADLLLEGAPLLDNIDNELFICFTEVVQDELVYYASFPDDGASTVTLAKFTSSNATDFNLMCSLSGQKKESYFRYWNLDC